MKCFHEKPVADGLAIEGESAIATKKRTKNLTPLKSWEGTDATTLFHDKFVVGVTKEFQLLTTDRASHLPF